MSTLWVIAFQAAAPTWKQEIMQLPKDATVPKMELKRQRTSFGLIWPVLM